MNLTGLKYDPIKREFRYEKPGGFILPKIRRLNHVVKEFNPLMKFITKFVLLVSMIIGFIFQILPLF